MNKIIKYAISNEKSIRLMESENSLVFVVDSKARKPEIKSALESIFSVKIESIRTLHARNGTKRAYVRFSIDNPAIDIATDLGLI